MTIYGFWSALSPSCSTSASASTLANKTLAIDTPIWLVEAQTSPSLNQYHRNPVLFLVYTRTISLLKVGVTPIFVMEGANSKRRSSSNSSRNVTFNQLQTELASMLQLLNVSVFYADGEAESLCGYLNENGVVDGVISNDADAFLYGCKTLFTNFTSNFETTKQLNSAYLFTDKNTRNNIFVNGVDLSTKDRLVTFALLVGSDVANNEKGVINVGWKKALEFMGTLKPTESGLDVLRNLPAAVVSSSTHSSCSICRHDGNKKSHETVGCVDCGTGPNTKCHPYPATQKIRDRLVSKIPNFAEFPSETLISTYSSASTARTVDLGSIKKLLLASSRPHLKKLLKSRLCIFGHDETGKKSIENVVRSFAKTIVRYDMINSALPSSTDYFSFRPLEITKRLQYKGASCLSVSWSMLLGSSKSKRHAFSTNEFYQLVEARYPILVSRFLEAERTNTQKQANGTELNSGRNKLFNGVMDKENAAGLGEKKGGKKKARYFGGHLAEVSSNEISTRLLSTEYSSL